MTDADEPHATEKVQEENEVNDENNDVVIDPQTDWVTEEPVNNDVDCFDYYTFQSVSVSVGPDQEIYQPGTTAQFSGVITNNNEYPIFDGNLFVRIGKKNENALQEGQFIVDEFVAVQDIAIGAKGQKSVAFSWDMPIYREEGTYVVDYFFSVGKKFNLGGLPFSNEILAGTANFDVSSTITDSVSFEKSATAFNGEPYQHIGSWPKVPAGSDVVITNVLRNSFDYEKMVNVTQELYRWDSLNPQDKLDSHTTTITIPADTTQEIGYKVPETTGAVYYVKTIANYDEDVNSIINVRFSTNAARARLNFPAITKFPLRKDDSAALFTCFHNSTQGSVNGSVSVKLEDQKGRVIDELQYDGNVPSAMSAIKKDLIAKKDYDYVKLTAQVKDEKGELVDAYEVVYDCAKIGACVQKQPILMTIMRWGAYILFVVVSFVIVVALMKILQKKRLQRRMNMFLLGCLFSWSLLCVHSTFAVGEQSLSSSVNWSLSQTGSVTIMSHIASGNATLAHNIGANTVTPACGGSVTFSYNPALTFNATGGDWDTPNGSFCNNTFAGCFSNIASVGQRITSGNSTGYIYWTATQPTVSLSSSNTGIMTCSGMTCKAVPGKSGSVTITATTSGATGRIWALAGVSLSKYKSVSPTGTILGVNRIGSSAVWYSPTEDRFRFAGDSDGSGKRLSGYSPSFLTKDFGGKSFSWTVTVGSCAVSGACNAAVTRTNYAYTASGPSTPLCTVGTASPATVAFPAGKYGSASTVNWKCLGVNGGASPSCSAARIAPVASCGSAANGVVTSTQPSANLCGAGSVLVNPPGVTVGSGKWQWSCRHSVVGAVPQTVNCSVPAPASVNGTCGTGSTVAAGTYLWNETIFRGKLCEKGSPTPAAVAFPTYGQTVSWGCNGLFGGTNTATTACKAIRGTPPPCSCNPDSIKTYPYTATSVISPLCTQGQASITDLNFTGYGPENKKTWTCSNGTGATSCTGVAANCSAQRETPPPCACDTTVAQLTYPYTTTSITPKCTNGAVFPLTSLLSFPLNKYLDEGKIGWSCITGVGDTACSGESASCSAQRETPPACTCGTATQTYSTDKPTKNLCKFGNPTAVQGEETWKWTCGGEGVCTNPVSCQTECINTTIDAPTTIYLKKNNTKLKAKVRLDGKSNISSGTCIIKMSGVPDTDSNYVSGADETVEVDFDYPNVASVNIDADCKFEGRCGAGNSANKVTIKNITPSLNVTSLCAEKTCNAQGRCQSTPKSGVTSVDDCKAACSSDADCSTGRMIETRP